ncbi:MAG: phage protease, partial [Firmicutes bacterium]|nr:phage protease [Bacillota bacterium]
FWLRIMPAEHMQRWPGIDEKDYLDPVNFRYPCPDAEQTAARYWGQADNRAQYSQTEQAIINQRLEQFKKKFKLGEYREQVNKDLTPFVLEAQAIDGVPEMIQLLPAGTIRSQKGSFLVDGQAVQEILTNFDLKINDLVIDYEHQTLTGEVAPAAGWIKEMLDRGPDGIWGKVEWTPKSREFLTNREYRYFSPVILVRKSDNRVIAIHSGALTNTPAIDGMEPIVNKFSLKQKEDVQDMNLLEKLRQKLGLAAEATEETVLQTVDNLAGRAKVVAHKDVLSLLDLGEGASLDEAKGKIIALKNPSGHVSVEEFNALKQKLALKERDDLVALALKQGKVAPAQKAWAEEYAMKDPAGFTAFLAHAPQVVPVTEVAGGAPPAGGGGKIDEAQLLINKQLGISEEDFKKFGGDK